MTNALPWGDAPLVSLEELLESIDLSVDILDDNPQKISVNSSFGLSYERTLRITIRSLDGKFTYASQYQGIIGEDYNITFQMISRMLYKMFNFNIDVSIDDEFFLLFNYQKNYIEKPFSIDNFLTVHAVISKSGDVKFYTTINGSDLVAELIFSKDYNYVYPTYASIYPYYKRNPTTKNAKDLFQSVQILCSYGFTLSTTYKNFIEKKATEILDKYENIYGVIEND